MYFFKGLKVILRCNHMNQHHKFHHIHSPLDDASTTISTEELLSSDNYSSHDDQCTRKQISENPFDEQQPKKKKFRKGHNDDDDNVCLRGRKQGRWEGWGEWTTDKPVYRAYSSLAQQ